MKKIKILFIHPNFPGQFKHLINELVKTPNAELAFITSKPDADMEGVNIQVYETPKIDNGKTHRYLRGAHSNLYTAQEVTKSGLLLKQSGFIPDAVVGHIGWSSTIFMKELFPKTKVIAYCEWFFRPETAWETFAGEPLSIDKKASIKIQNTSTILGLQDMDVGVSPMRWQRDTHPEYARRNIEIIHEGIDTEVCKPRSRSHLNIPGANLPKDAKIVTYISRSLEPARGFFTFMESVQELCKLDKDVQFVVVGRERSAYSQSTGSGPSYKEQALERYDCDWSRVHFTGKLSYEHYLQVLSNSMVHIYLSSPLFLSWSMLEAMACGCTLVSSNNAPVTEVIEHDVNGRLVSFFDAKNLSKEVHGLLNDRATAKRLANAARQTILNKYDLKICVSQWKSLLIRTIYGDQ